MENELQHGSGWCEGTEGRLGLLVAHTGVCHVIQREIHKAFTESIVWCSSRSIHVQRSIVRLEITSGEQHFILHWGCCTVLELPVEREGHDGAVLGGWGGNLPKFHSCARLKRGWAGRRAQAVRWAKAACLLQAGELETNSEYFDTCRVMKSHCATAISHQWALNL